ncbi:hypothetical protein SLS62_002653 [Diatrype stigma]|uniref:Transferase family protein n=1 Tax=Diatrype stigma TaxID=117547 RepID=A0AAN9UX10_9PEZI
MSTSNHVQTRVFPPTKPEQPQKTPLSILDATVARFAPSSAIWLFEELPNAVSETEFLETLKSSFVEVLGEFPQWTGQLKWVEARLGGKHTERFNRPEIVWGTAEDPGAEWNTVNHPLLRIDAVVPGPTAWTSGTGVWMATDFPTDAMVSATPLALHDLRTYKGLPALTVQVNLFAGGGYGIGVKLAHMLGDAQSLLVFVSQWAAKSQNAFLHTINNNNHAGGVAPAAPISTIMGPPIFDPAALDARAAGDIDASAADSQLVATARALPLHRFDWWDPALPSYLAPLADVSRPPPELLAVAGPGADELQTPAPWSTWDLTRPVSRAVLHFSKAEIENIKAAAVRENADITTTTGYNADPGTHGTSEVQISRLDALLAHLFETINRARFGRSDDAAAAAEPEDEGKGGAVTTREVFLNVTLDARRRVSPPLPEMSIGSPLFLTYVKATLLEVGGKRPSGEGEGEGDDSVDSSGGVVMSQSLGTTARKLRQTMLRFTPDKVAAMLHDAAHEVSPQRLWQAFAGSHHVLVTSWLRLPLYDIEFVGGQRPRHVHPAFTLIDGIVIVRDSAPDGDAAGGIDVDLFLDSEAMLRLLEGAKGKGGLRKFRA